MPKATQLVERGARIGAQGLKPHSAALHPPILLSPRQPGPQGRPDLMPLHCWVDGTFLWVGQGPPLLVHCDENMGEEEKGLDTWFQAWMQQVGAL